MFNPAIFITSVNSIEQNPPNSAISHANAWADAFASGYGIPSPPTLTSEAGKAQMKALFIAAYNSPNQGKTLMNAGVSVFAATMAPGMLPAFASKPPMGYTGFDLLTLGSSKTPGTIGPALAATTTPWFMTGLAVNVSSGVTIPWS